MIVIQDRPLEILYYEAGPVFFTGTDCLVYRGLGTHPSTLS